MNQTLQIKALIPHYVTKQEARKEFVRVVTEIGPDKLRPVDINLLADYANTHADVIELTDLVRSEGYTLIGAKGGEYTNPKQNILSGKQAHLSQLRRDLYFTPKSRVEKSKVAGKAQGILDALRESDEGSED